MERYVHHHGLDVQLGVDVRKLDRAADDSGWVIHTTNGPIHARAVVMATGYNRIPFIPEWPGKKSFEGELLHDAIVSVDFAVGVAAFLEMRPPDFKGA